MDSYASIPWSRIANKADFVPAGLPLARRRLSLVGLLEAAALPLGLFITIFWALSFQVHYYHPEVCYVFIAVGFIIPTAILLRAFVIHRRRALGLTDHDPIWLYKAAGTTFVATCLAVILGFANYRANTVKYYDIQNLSVVNGVNRLGTAATDEGMDVMAASGQQYMDAMLINFQKGTSVNEKMSIGFKDGTLYCVAPITRGTEPAAFYDFWAVGVDCCDPFGGDFWCGGDIRDDEARTAVRWMGDSERTYFRLAVNQAEEQYNIHARFPMFFTWSRDGASTISAYWDNGRRFFVIFTVVFIFVELGIIAFFLFLHKPKQPNEFY